MSRDEEKIMEVLMGISDIEDLRNELRISDTNTSETNHTHYSSIMEKIDIKVSKRSKFQNSKIGEKTAEQEAFSRNCQTMPTDDDLEAPQHQIKPWGNMNKNILGLDLVTLQALKNSQNENKANPKIPNKV
jgi:hypothetical protein